MPYTHCRFENSKLLVTKSSKEPVTIIIIKRRLLKVLLFKTPSLSAKLQYDSSMSPSESV